MITALFCSTSASDRENHNENICCYSTIQKFTYNCQNCVRYSAHFLFAMEMNSQEVRFQTRKYEIFDYKTFFVYK